MWRVSKGATLRYPQPGGPDERRHRFEELYAANCGPILGYVLRRTDNPHDAADVIAETFLTAWRRLDAVPPGDEARLWLYGVARRVLANYRRGERRRWWWWLAGIPAAAAAAAAAALIAAPVAHNGGPGGRGDVGRLRPDAHALAFTPVGRYIDVIVRDPLADQASYNAEFKAHGLDITLSLVPVSPSLVGTVVEVSTSGPDGNSITTITAKGRCWTGGGGSECPVGLRVPAGYRGQATFVFGRAARPGEQYESTTGASAPGEMLHGLNYAGKRVSTVLAMLGKRHVTVLAMLGKRHVTVPTYRDDGRVLTPGQVPGSWYVYDAVPWAPQQVLLFIGPTPSQAYGAARPAPSPSRSG
jgi:DNA-directed RNA polymerase specialized sigma24 family protein